MAVTTTVTGVDGAFRIGPLPHGIVSVLVESAEYSARTISLPVPSKEVLVSLREAGTITGTVHDGNRNAIDGVRVSAVRSGVRGAVAAKTWSDREGTFALTGLPAAQYILAAEDVSGRRRLSVDVVAGGTTSVDIALHTHSDSVSGRVIDEATRAPIAGAAVFGPGVQTSSSQDGHFELHGLPFDPSGFVGIGAEAPGYSPRGDKVPFNSRSADIALPRDLIVTGRVVDGASRSVISAFSIVQGGDVAKPLVAADGRFRIEWDVGRPPDPPRLFIESTGYRSASRQIQGGPGETLELGDIGLDPVDYPVIHVKDPQGRSVAGAAVHVVQTPHRDSGRGRRGVVQAGTAPSMDFARALVGAESFVGTTDDRGEVRCEVSAAPQCFVALHRDFAASSMGACPMFASAAGDRIAITLRPPGWISGRVRGGNQPFNTMSIVAMEERVSASVDGSGNFRLGQLSPGKHTVTVASSAPLDAGTGSHVVTVHASMQRTPREA